MSAAQLAPETISIVLPGERRTVPILKLVSICGIDGFALHRGDTGLGYVVSDIKTGFRFPSSLMTKSATLKAAENDLLLCSALRGVTPQQFLDWSRKQTPKMLRKMKVPHA